MRELPAIPVPPDPAVRRGPHAVPPLLLRGQEAVRKVPARGAAGAAQAGRGHRRAVQGQVLLRGEGMPGDRTVQGGLY